MKNNKKGYKNQKHFLADFMNVVLKLLYKAFEVMISKREAMIIAQIVGVRWVEKSRLIGTGQASGQCAEAYFFLVPLSGIVTFSAMEKVRERICV